MLLGTDLRLFLPCFSSWARFDFAAVGLPVQLRLLGGFKELHGHLHQDKESRDTANPGNADFRWSTQHVG